MMLQWCTSTSIMSTFLRYCLSHQTRRASVCQTSNSRTESPASGFEWLFKCAPSFYIDGNNVEVLNEPSEFYNTLKANICAAKERITIASLYLGTGSLEQDLLSSIKDRLSRANRSALDLKVSILLDHPRGSRGKSKSSRTMLLPLLKEFKQNVNFAFYHTPQLRGLLRWIVPEKFNETIGVSHLKVYLTDNSFIISGANLSNDYFTNRQDRYIHVKNSCNAADYFNDLVRTVSSFSLHLQEDNTTVMNCNTFQAHPYKDWDRGIHFKKAANLVVNNFIQKWMQKSRANVEQFQGDTIIFPLLQCRPLWITQDEEITSRIFQNVPEGSMSYLATGYFNLTSNYLNCILQAKGSYNVLCAHPMANGFYKAGGIIGGIPDAFTQFAKEFHNKINQSNQAERITLQEYVRSQWTFHAKGLWYSPPDEELPTLTLIGSPNFGHRSAKKDLENQIVLMTSNHGLRKQLSCERDSIYRYAARVTGSTFQADDRRVPLWARVVSGFTRSFF